MDNSKSKLKMLLIAGFFASFVALAYLTGSVLLDEIIAGSIIVGMILFVKNANSGNSDPLQSAQVKYERVSTDKVNKRAEAYKTPSHTPKHAHDDIRK